MRIQSLIALLFGGVLILSGCDNSSALRSSGSDKKSSHTPDLPHTPDPEGPDPNVPNTPSHHHSCYLGERSDSSACLKTMSFSDMEQVPSSYEYLDPYRDSGLGASVDRSFYTAPERVIDLSGLDQKTRLAPNFVLSELMSISKGRYGLFSTKVLAIIQKIRDNIATPMFINSAYRSPGYNRRVGGASWSRHMYGDAIDFSAPGKSFRELGQVCLDHGASFYLIYDAHIHCDWRYYARDESFFPPAGPTPSQAVLAQAMSELISLEASLIAPQLWHLQAQMEELEDGHLPTIEWTIIAPDGTTNHYSGAADIEYRATQSGFHYISVTVGGALTQTVDLEF